MKKTRFIFPTGSLIKKSSCLCISLFLASAITFAQNQRITLNLKNVPLKQALDKISKEAKVSVAYSKEFVNPNQTVNVSASDATLQEVMTNLLKGSNIDFRIADNKIYLFDKSLKQTSPQKSGQTQVVTGKVLDQATGEPMIGVNVMVKGTTSGTVTNLDGEYSIQAAPGNTLVFSFVGYKDTHATVDGKKEKVVRLNENSTLLNDVVVVGYGTQKKVNLTGSVATVKGEQLESRPITSVSAGLQGLLPGVTITQGSGQPGNSTDIKIRGVNTINSSTSPLILIDGVAGGDLNLLNPDDVENVSVLKDAASSAIYGARAGNGVILITTKKGSKQDKTTISYSGYVGWQTPTALPKLVNGREYMELANEAYVNAGFGKLYLDESFAAYDNGTSPNDYSNTDWISESFKKSAFQTGHNVNISGGTGKSSYYMSYGYLDQDGLVVGDSYASNRHNARIHVNTEVNKRLTVSGNIGYVDYYQKECGYSGTTGVFRLAQRMSPLYPVMWQQQDENGNWSDSEYYSSSSIYNPVYVAYNSGYRNRNSRTFNGQTNVIVKIIEGLTVNGMYAANFYNREYKKFVPVMPKYYSDLTEQPSNVSLKSYINKSFLNTLTQTLNATLNYEHQFGKNNINLLGGFSQEWAKSSDLSGTRTKILLEGIEEINGGTEEIENSGSGEEWALRSFFGRVNYNFAEKYLFEANVRMDGTSRFAKGNRWGCFPSFSAGWRFSEESFMEFATAVMDMGKLRASWGELGNQNVGSNYYPFVTVMQAVDKNYPIGNTENVGYQVLALGNRNIKWETLRMLNLGADFSFFNNRLTASFDWFKKNNINALVTGSYPLVIGFSSASALPLENMGEIENKGWELSLSWRDVIGKVTYGATFNLADSKNKIKDLGTSAPVLGDNIRRVGDPIDAYYGYRTAGLLQVSDFGGQNEFGNYINPNCAVLTSGIAVQPGDIKYVDISGPDGTPDGVINDYDKVVIGNKIPRYSYSFKGFAEWKGFDFSFYLQGVGKANGYITDEARHCFINDYSVPKKSHLDRWTSENTNAKYPRMYYAQTHNRYFSDYWVEDASYLRLKNIQLGYTLPKQWSGKLGLSKLRAYFSADNLFTITNYFENFDPEVQETSGDIYPQVKTYVFGLNLTF